MKRIVSVFILTITLALLLVGCSGKDGVSNVPEKNLQDYTDFITTFQELVSKLPDFTIIQLKDVPLDDDSVCHTFYIKDTILDESYRLRVDTNKDSKITWVFLSAQRKTYGHLQFPVFSAYLYRAMGFPEIDADSFYNKYDLFSNEKIFEYDVCGDYEITSMTIDTTSEITFSVSLAKDK